MIITYDGQSYPFDFDDVSVKQGIKIEKFMGCPFDDWGKRLQAGDLQARQVLGWMILHQGDLSVPIEDTDFKMVALGKALDAAFAAANPAAEDEPVPTVAAVSNGHVPAAALSLPSSPGSSGEISR